MAGKVQVPKYLKPREWVLVEPGATVGAVVGVNLRNPDGSLWVPPVPEGTIPIGSTYVYWRNIRERPKNVDALAAINTAGVYVITAVGQSEAAALDDSAPVRLYRESVPSPRIWAEFDIMTLSEAEF